LSAPLVERLDLAGMYTEIQWAQGSMVALLAGALLAGVIGWRASHSRGGVVLALVSLALWVAAWRMDAPLHDGHVDLVPLPWWLRLLPAALVIAIAARVATGSMLATAGTPLAWLGGGAWAMDRLRRPFDDGVIDVARTRAEELAVCGSALAAAALAGLAAAVAARSWHRWRDAGSGSPGSQGESTGR
jgi:hypothetical protein